MGPTITRVKPPQNRDGLVKSKSASRLPSAAGNVGLPRTVPTPPPPMMGYGRSHDHLHARAGLLTIQQEIQHPGFAINSRKPKSCFAFQPESSKWMTPSRPASSNHVELMHPRVGV